jgi:hypothetical protein
MLHQCQVPIALRSLNIRGFALPLAMGMGLVMIALATTATLVAQNDRKTSAARRETAGTLLVTENGIARILANLKPANNGILLGRNYDPINPKTGENYLGPDGIPNTDDETNTAVDEWTNYNPPCLQTMGWGAPNLNLTATLGPDNSYRLLAYRYDENQEIGSLLVEGTYKGKTSAVMVAIGIEPVLDNFPGVLAINPNPPGDPWEAGAVVLRNRKVLGANGNIYYPPEHSADPSITGYAAPGNADRSKHLNAIFASSALDGTIGDPVEGKLFACRLRPMLPVVPQGADLGVIDTSRTLSGAVGGITHVRVDRINLDGNETLTVDTTAGPVYLYFKPSYANWWAITLRNTAKILNIRTDGQQPRVGDFRIITQGQDMFTLYDQTCIQNAFIYSLRDELRFLTSGSGCPGGKNTNFEGVVWAEAVLSSKNNASNRDAEYLDFSGQPYDTTVTPGTQAGIAVPDEISSLADLLKFIDLPIRYRFGAVKTWKRVSS